MATGGECEELIMVVCQSSIADEVVQRLSEAGSDHFTLLHGALGVGDTGRHEGTPVWPGQNSIVLCCVNSRLVPAITGTLKELHDSRPDHSLGVKVFSAPVRELL
jgi:hypothetical protein